MEGRVRWTVALLGGVLLPLAGCRVNRHGGTNNDVSIETPLGGLNVKTDPAAILAKVGLPAYPGARTAPESQQDKHSADVNLSFGSFKLQVLAAALQTPDSQQQVEAFYRKTLAQYSDVIACHGHEAVGMPKRTGMGLTCSEDKHVKTVHIDDDDPDDLELKAGSPLRQHLAILKRREGTTRIELVSLELPHLDGND